MRLGGIEESRPTGIGATEVISQVVALPLDFERYILEFQRYLVSEPNPGEDLQFVEIRDGPTGKFEEIVWSVQGEDRRWGLEQLPLEEYAGQEIRLQIGVKNDGAAGHTAMYVDNVSLRACKYIGEGEPTLPEGARGSLEPSTQTPTPDSETDEETGLVPDRLEGLGAIAVLAGIFVVIAILVWGILYALRSNQPSDY